VTTRTDFYARLLTLAESGRPVPCLASHEAWWTSDDAHDQARAAAECLTCPALALCAAYITECSEIAGVYAGLTVLDRNPRKSTRQEIAS
jgi:hypothetical protein